jgi:hypothetical protein
MLKMVTEHLQTVLPQIIGDGFRHGPRAELVFTATLGLL